tara:strand:+ start:841 stop:993 length:153 start_codon:yes stop_codon:yes gene_type:complete
VLSEEINVWEVNLLEHEVTILVLKQKQIMSMCKRPVYSIHRAIGSKQFVI